MTRTAIWVQIPARSESSLRIYLPLSAEKHHTLHFPGHSLLSYSPPLKKGAILDLPLPSVILYFSHSVTFQMKMFRHTFLRNCKTLKIETWYTRGQWADVSCIPESGCCCLFFPLFLHFSFSPSFKHKNISSHFSLELLGLEDWNVVHTWTMGGCIVYTEIRLLRLIHPFIFSFFFLSILNIKFFVSLFLGTVRPRMLKHGTHWTMGGCIVYTGIMLLLLMYLFIYSFFFPIFKN